MTSAAAMLSSGGGAGGATERGTPTRLTMKDDSGTNLVPTPDAGSIGRGVTRSPSSSSALSTSPALPMAGLMMHEPERIRMRTPAAGSSRRHVKDFNDSITCTLCNGYLVEATTVNDCLHAFCRSCIVKYLDSNKYCPRCKSYNSKPITVANLRPDRTLRALVYKMVPSLHKSENQRMVQFYASISSTIVSSEDDPSGQEGIFQLLDDQNFFSPDEPISLSLEYLYETLAEDQKLPITYLQCPAAVTMHHLYKFILTKNGLVVGSDTIRVEIIYEEEILPHDFTLMDVAYCFDYKRIAPMRFFYRILIQPTAKLAPTASACHRVEGQDKNSTPTSASPTTPVASVSQTPPTAKSSTGSANVPATATNNQKQTKTGQQQQQQEGISKGPAEIATPKSSPAAVVNGQHRMSKPMVAPSSEGTRVGKAPSGNLKLVLVPPKGKPEPCEPKRSPPPLKAIQPAPVVEQVPAKKPAESDSKPPPGTILKCYVNLKKQTVAEGPSGKSTQEEIPRLKIDLPRLKTKLSVPRGPGEPSTGPSPPGSSSSSAATSPSSGSSSTAGKSPVWPMGKEEYAKTIGLKPVYAGCAEPLATDTKTASSSHRKRKKGKHSKETGSSGKRRKLHAEISSQHDDASLKMKVKLTEKPPKHERLRSSGNEEETAPQPKSPPAIVPPPEPAKIPVKVPPKVPAKVIDITRDDDEVKFVHSERRQQPAPVAPEPKPPAAPPSPLPPSPSAVSSKDKLNEMRNVRHKPMVYIPNLDRSLSADAPGASSSINSLLESVGAKVPLLKPTPALIPTSVATSLSGKSQLRHPMLARPMQTCPPLAYPLAASSTVVSSAARSMPAPAAIKRSMSTDGGANVKVPRLEPPSLVAPASLLPPKQPIHAPMFNFAKGANRAKAAQQAANVAPPTQPEPVPYRSPISASYTKEIPPVKKPIPNLQLPPVSISVTKMSDPTSSPVSSSTSSSNLLDNGRPALEILRIAPNAPVADKPSLAPFVTPKVAPKTTRPPPATIPLIKIKKPTPVGNGGGADSVTSSTMRPKMAGSGMRSHTDLTTASAAILDLSGGTPRRLSDDVIILDHSPTKGTADSTNRPKVLSESVVRPGKPSVPVLKRPPDMISLATGGGQSVPRTLAPLPKLTEIHRANRGLSVRQPNASIRSIPNPSALAFRGAPAVSSSSSMPQASSQSSVALMATFSSTSVPTSNGGRPFGNATNAPSVAKPSTNTSLSNGSAVKQPTLGAAVKGPGVLANGARPPTTNGVSSSSPNNTFNNNNNSKIANANTPAVPAKKTIENVAAELKAVAATADTTHRQPTTTASSSSASSSVTASAASSTSVGNREDPSRKPTANQGSPTAVSSPAVTAAIVGAVGVPLPVTTGTVNRANSSSIVTSVTATTMAATVTNGSSRSSPASTVKVG
ncbi:protein suppressor 2 of zeste [Anopheles nili]|uniref:protein suppressor 2 of zeste n=1 Tax=Anopheles nili TaxID=185578 RepID=UPI00237A3BF0|nr:protein suppressor 2 of zeste [Anopheles nili]